MTNREKFIFEVEELLKEKSDFLSEEAKAYFEELKNGTKSSNVFTYRYCV